MIHILIFFILFDKNLTRIDEMVKKHMNKTTFIIDGAGLRFDHLS